MVPQKFSDLGFDIAGFGAKSKVLRFENKPIFVFNANSRMDETFISQICTTYLQIREKRKGSVSLRIA
jgi:hypothetical protein